MFELYVRKIYKNMSIQKNIFEEILYAFNFYFNQRERSLLINENPTFS